MLADAEAVAKFFGIAKKDVPLNPELEENPK
jgi:hypothetical protein